MLEPDVRGGKGVRSASEDMSLTQEKTVKDFRGPNGQGLQCQAGKAAFCSVGRKKSW